MNESLCIPEKRSARVFWKACYLLSSLFCVTSIRGQSGASISPRADALQAQVTMVTGQVTRMRDAQPWAISSGDQVPMQQTVTTGEDGYAQLQVAGGSKFEIFSNSKVIFRQNIANPNDIVDVMSGRVRLQLRPKRGEQQRVFSPSAIITTRFPTSLAMAIDEDETVRIDVIEGQIRVQHTRLPSNEAVLVRAIDSILVQKDEAISRRIDRGTLYRYKARILTALTFGHAGHDAEPIEGNKLVAQSHSSRCIRLPF